MNKLYVVNVEMIQIVVEYLYYFNLTTCQMKMIDKKFIKIHPLIDFVPNIHGKVLIPVQ